MKICKLITILTGIILLVACGKDPGGSNLPIPEPDPEPLPQPQPTEKLEINVNPTIVTTKATDYGFETGDFIGIYVVNYNGSTPGTLKGSGNHVDNMRHTYTGIWTPDSKIYWLDESTHADIYMYYPYTPTISSVSEMPFAVVADQTTESAYKKCDLMAGKASDVAPTERAIIINASHLLSRITITLEAGNGFTQEGLAASDVSVAVRGLQTNTTVNLTSSETKATGTATSVKTLKNDGKYMAIVVPQTPANGITITTTVDGVEYDLHKQISFESGKNYNFTITLSKTSAGINVNIGPWDNDDIDYGGIAE